MVSSRMHQKVEILDPGCFTPHYDLNLGVALARRGWKVEWITSRHQFGHVPEVQALTVRVSFFKCLERIPLNRFAVFRGVPQFRQMVKVLCYAIDLLAYHRVLVNKQPGILHVQWALLPFGDAAFWRKWQRHGWRVIFTCHDPFIPIGSMPRLLGRFYRLLCESANAVIVHGPSAGKILEDKGIRPDRIKIVPPGPPTLFPASDRSEARRALQIDSEIPVLLFFGYIKPYKGLAVLLRSLPRVKAAAGKVILLIGGELMEPRSRYRDLIEKLGLADDVRWSDGYVSDQVGSLCFAAADAVVLPYIQASHSGVVLTAYAYQKPVVASAVGGVPEMVEDGISGLLVPPGNPDALARAIIEVLGNKAMADKMALRGRQLISSRFNWDEIARQTEEIYLQLR
jgi:glycosyltransferase involved in cell wall biosynthesis